MVQYVHMAVGMMEIDREEGKNAKIVYISNSRDYTEQNDINENKWLIVKSSWTLE